MSPALKIFSSVYEIVICMKIWGILEDNCETVIFMQYVFFFFKCKNLASVSSVSFKGTIIRYNVLFLPSSRTVIILSKDAFDPLVTKEG